MYAVIKTGGKQYNVTTGDVVKLEKIAGEEGKEVVFNEVLALGEKIGTPLVAGASVKAIVLKQAKDAKVIVFKKKNRRLREEKTIFLPESLIGSANYPQTIFRFQDLVP